MFVATIVVSALLALVSTGSAMAKLSKQPKLVEQLTGLGVPMGWLPKLAAAELAGAVGLLVGLAVAPIGVAAAIGLVLYFLGAVITHVKASDMKGIPAPLVFALLAVATAVLRLVSA